ncbi:MAG: ABC transporter ATP-binding protein [Deltaproteobacteria bacterium]|nr:MAG: ABC transporter ATP-binding protein [Deltaproteobacteria bacterium]
MNTSPLLELQGITCRFPGGVVANQSVDLSVKSGQVYAILGENGAGKSTLMKVAFGMLQPTEGAVLWKGQTMSFRSSADAMKQGIGMVHQHFMLIPRFTVWENIVLGCEPHNMGSIDEETAREKVRNLSKTYGLKVDPDAVVEDLSVGEQQRVEILKALYRDIELLILDEPTAVLTPQETEELIGTLKQLVSNGLTILFISHKLREVRSLAHRVLVLRKGKYVADVSADEHSEEELAALMVGRPPSPVKLMAEEEDTSEVVLSLNNLQVQDNRGLAALSGVSLDVHRGEIVGIAGVEGNGQGELLEAITGLRKLQSGNIYLEGQAIEKLSVQERFPAGLAHIPQDRQLQGLVLDLPITENILLGRHQEEQFAEGGFWIDTSSLRAHTEQAIHDFGIEPDNPDLPVRSLSGGNQQKVVVARELMRPNAKAYIVAHPTRGVDIGAIEAIHAQLLQRREQGAAILLVSSELPELLALCDRIAVLYEGQIVAMRSPKSTNEAELGLLMTGGHSEEDSPSNQDVIH